MNRSRRLVDVSHTVHDGLLTYPGMPGPEISDWLSREASRARYAEGTEFQIGRITMVANTGTYVDAPSHRFDSAADLSQLDLARLADLEGVVVRHPVASEGRTVGAEAFLDVDVEGRAVLVHTDWDLHWGTEAYGLGHAFLTEAAARLLVERQAALVGIDSLNIDDTEDGRRPVHTALLEAGITVVEHLCGLRELPDEGFRFFAVPVKVRGMGSFPVRAFAIVDEAGR